MDNLKLGYGGTKTEMERLIADANEYAASIGQASDLSIDSFADIIQAIELIQEKQNIAGTTAKEASTTIEGSFKAVSAAWQNLVVGFARSDADIDGLITALVDNAETAFSNILPVAEKALTGIGDFVGKIAPIIGAKLPELVNLVLPQLIETGMTFLTSLVTALTDNIQILLDGLIQIFTAMSEAFLTNLPLIVELGMQLLIGLAQGIAEAIPDLIPQIIEVMLTIVDTLIDHIDELIIAGLTIIIALADALIDNLPKLIDRLPEIIENIVSALTSPEMITKLIEAGIKLLTALIIDLPQIIGTLVAAIPQIIEALVKGFQDNIPEMIKQGSELFESMLTNLPAFLEKMKKKGEEIVLKLIGGLSKLGDRMRKIFGDAWDSVMKLFPDFGKVGNDIVKGLWNGINDMSGWLKDKIQSFGDDVLQGLKDFFGIHSPSKVMRDIIGKNLVLGLSEGVEDNEDAALSSAESLSKNLEKAFDNSYSIDAAVNGITSSIAPMSDNIQTISSAADISRIMNTTTPANNNGNMTIILELDKQQFAKAVYKYNNAETQRIGVKLAKGV